MNNSRLRLKPNGPRSWLLETDEGCAVGGIEYVHAADGNHYQPWVMVDGARADLGEPSPQLAMAARAIDAQHKQRSG